MAWNQSETTKPCTCGWLDRAAAEPSNPIVWDAELSEYNLVYGRYSSILRFCPLCGCKAPASRRESLFEDIPTAEMERLQVLVKGIRTLDDARRILGEPEEVIEPGGAATTPESNGEPSRTTFYGKSLHWLNISQAAVVCVDVPALEQVSVRVHAKLKPDWRDRRG